MASVIRGDDNFDSAGGNAVKAWVNFNGTGTVAIRDSYNVDSITDFGTGNFTVNFTTALPDSSYATVAGLEVQGTIGFQNYATTGVDAICRNMSNSSSDFAFTSVAILN